ncbi:MAG: SDR family NAD(P)-dependent oxidoreductase [Bacteroidetes bacterium]|nr:SDR family NAD(P)-dependent oxidoreductase [Bacteroidota bacterium]
MNIIITGASKGIGKAIAREYAASGHTVFLCSRNEEQLKQTAAAIEKEFPAVKVHVKAADLSVKHEAELFADWCLQQAVPDILVNNAGAYLPGNISNEPDGNMEAMMAVNFYSAYHLTRRLLPAMLQKKAGHVFNMCSIASLDAYDGGGSYSISKFALWGFTKNLRHELKEKGIKVTGIFPGAVLTDSWGNYDNSNGRIMEAGDVAKMLVAAGSLSSQAVVEDIILRPQLGDL